MATDWDLLSGWDFFTVNNIIIELNAPALRIHPSALWDWLLTLTYVYGKMNSAGNEGSKQSNINWSNAEVLQGKNKRLFETLFSPAVCYDSHVVSARKISCLFLRPCWADHSFVWLMIRSNADAYNMDSDDQIEPNLQPFPFWCYACKLQ